MPLCHRLYPGPVSWTEEGTSVRLAKLHGKAGDVRYSAVYQNTGPVHEVVLAWYSTKHHLRKPKGILNFDIIVLF